MRSADLPTHLAECRDEAAAALPVVARAVAAWSAVERGVRARNWETIDEFNAVWDETMAAGAGALRVVLGELADMIASTDVAALQRSPAMTTPCDH